MTSAADDLELLAGAEEVEIATVLSDGAPGWVPIWVVRVADSLFARSFRGPQAAWHRSATGSGTTSLRVGDTERDAGVTAIAHHLRTEIDAAYRAKYAAYPQFVEPMTSDEIVATTVRFDLA